MSRETVRYQRLVVDRFNVSKHPFYQICVNADVGHSGGIDYFFEFNCDSRRVLIGSNFDTILFLDIDCIPLCTSAIDYYLEKAADGFLVGNVQRAAHIDNGEHLFVAPSALAISMATYQKLGRPSASPTNRGDVAEEFTYQAEARKIPIEMTMPSRYDAPSSEGVWSLGKDRPDFGRGTTFTHPTLGELFWHNFQTWQPGQQGAFQRKCAAILTK